MDEVLPPDRSDLTGSQEPGQGNGPDGARQHEGVVMGIVEQPGPASVAGEHQRGVGLTPLEEGGQLAIGRLRIP